MTASTIPTAIVGAATRSAGGIVPVVLHSFGYALDYVRELVANVPAAEIVAQPGRAADGGAGGVVIVNHPAWVIGHLTFVSQMIGEVVGLEPWLPDGWAGRYGPGSTPVSDASRYEAKAVLLGRLADAQMRLTTALLSLDEARLAELFPDPAFRDVFPTVGHALTQVLVGHAGYHAAQVALWRRAMGYEPLGRSFE